MSIGVVDDSGAALWSLTALLTIQRIVRNQCNAFAIADGSGNYIVIAVRVITITGERPEPLPSIGRCRNDFLKAVLTVLVIKCDGSIRGLRANDVACHFVIIVSGNDRKTRGYAENAF